MRPLLGGSTSGTEFATDQADCDRSIVIVNSSELDRARVSIVGSGLRDAGGGLRLTRQALRNAKVPLLSEVRDRAHSTISCVVPAVALEAAARALHGAFVEGNPIRHPLAASAQLMPAS